MSEVQKRLQIPGEVLVAEHRARVPPCELVHCGAAAISQRPASGLWHAHPRGGGPATPDLWHTDVEAAILCHLACSSIQIRIEWELEGFVERHWRGRAGNGNKLQTAIVQHEVAVRSLDPAAA
eukprot:scaffold90046_cov30-Tisochrysis_lutea.AAC.3